CKRPEHPHFRDAFPPRHRLRTDLCGRIYLPALGSVPITRGVNKTHASLMVILGLAFVPVMCVNVLNEIAALTLLRGADFLSVWGQPQREAMAMLFLDLHRYGYVIGWIFGPWLFFFGLLVFKSGFLPRILGVLLIAACFGYLADGLTPLTL